MVSRYPRTIGLAGAAWLATDMLSPDQKLPTTWSETSNIRWSAPIAGRGYGAPIVFDDSVVLQTADESVDSQSVVCLDRDTGKLRWTRMVHPSGAMRKNKKSTGASSTPAWDGRNIYVNFANSDAVVATALDAKGQIVWQREISAYVKHQGFGSSPILYQHVVLFSSDNKGGGVVTALDRSTGESVWRRERPEKANYTSPMLVHVAGRDQLIMIGCDQIVSYDPLTGSTLWETEGATTECVTSTVTDGVRIFTTGGYPRTMWPPCAPMARKSSTGKIAIESMSHRSFFEMAISTRF